MRMAAYLCFASWAVSVGPVGTEAGMAKLWPPQCSLCLTLPPSSLTSLYKHQVSSEVRDHLRITELRRCRSAVASASAPSS